MKRIRPIFIILVAVFGGDDLLVDRLFASQVRTGEDRDHPGRRIRSRGMGQGLSPGIRLLAQSKEPNPADLSKYRKGWTGGEKFDKLSEFPFMALLFNGWGFGVEYNEIRGHYYMLIDQLEIDPSRLKAGGVCLTCKTPFAPKLKQEMGENYFKDPYVEVHAKIPEKVPAHRGDVHRLPRQQDHGPDPVPLDPGQGPQGHG